MITLKRVAAGVLLALLWVLACAVVFLPACASSSGFTPRPVATSLVVNYATMKYIEQSPPAERGARARRVIDVVDLVLEAARGDAVTLQSLSQLAIDRVPEDLPASDRILAMSIINVVSQELAARIGHGGLESQTLVRVGPLLEQVKQAATFYLPPS